MSELVTQEMVDAAFHAMYADGARNIKWTALSKGIEAALKARKPEPGQPAADHQQLMQFYNVSTVDELIAAQSHHIEKLQAKLPATPLLRPTSVREG